MIFQVFPILLRKLGPGEKQHVLPWQQVEVSMTTLIVSMAGHSNREQMAQILDLLLVNISYVFGYKTNFHHIYCYTMFAILKTQTCEVCYERDFNVII
jgi:hypothetical protein